ncbi:troponin I, fast skeletal muscle-like isoform X2 [Oncorhynchus keta]|nr:troponin I, fast skeletal muscle-like isoform X2 [Oncorhynchus keta]XP_035593654.1 troponin I, fast skeletal muscle-like isoform X2 [Oncorhynchus keta]
MLQIAKGLLDAEAIEAVEDTFFYMDENCAAFDMPGSLAELQELCKTIHHQIDKVDEERYDLAGKGGKCDKEIEDLRIKVIEFQGLSADSMLQALLGSKHKGSMDFRANLKEVKKEVKEENKMQLVTGVRTLMTRQAWTAERRCLRPHNICGTTQSHFTCLSLCPNNKSVVVSHGCILYLDVRYIM